MASESKSAQEAQLRVAVSVFTRELADGGGGQPCIVELDPEHVFGGLARELDQHAAWSPMTWRNNERKQVNFAAASLLAVDWEASHDHPFPHDLYTTPASLIDFITSLRTGGSPLPDFAHGTQHGVRLIWLCDRRIDDGRMYLELNRRLALDFGADLAAVGLAVGFTAARHVRSYPLMEVACRVVR